MGRRVGLDSFPKRYTEFDQPDKNNPGIPGSVMPFFSGETSQVYYTVLFEIEFYSVNKHLSSFSYSSFVYIA